MVLVRQETSLPALSWQTVCDFENVPPSCALAMACPFRLRLPCTAARLSAVPFAAAPDAPMPIADAVWPLRPVDVAPTPKVVAEVPPTAAVPPVPAVALPGVVLLPWPFGPAPKAGAAAHNKAAIKLWRSDLVIGHSFQSCACVWAWSSPWW